MPSYNQSYGNFTKNLILHDLISGVDKRRLRRIIGIWTKLPEVFDALRHLVLCQCAKRFPETTAAVCGDLSALHSLSAQARHKKIAQMKYILYVIY